ncbi:hypothetical protein VTP01DRAFT_10133 [Rhizomucor pusillus]|uniref:uncharacterized protein n=1 Tax=Rhizomucor pusillus TaxID=4840 RepID=UPI0037444289
MAIQDLAVITCQPIGLRNHAPGPNKALKTTKATQGIQGSTAGNYRVMTFSVIPKVSSSPRLVGACRRSISPRCPPRTVETVEGGINPDSKLLNAFEIVRCIQAVKGLIATVKYHSNLSSASVVKGTFSRSWFRGTQSTQGYSRPAMVCLQHKDNSYKENTDYICSISPIFLGTGDVASAWWFLDTLLSLLFIAQHEPNGIHV